MEVFLLLNSSHAILNSIILHMKLLGFTNLQLKNQNICLELGSVFLT